MYSKILFFACLFVLIGSSCTDPKAADNSDASTEQTEEKDAFAEEFKKAYDTESITKGDKSKGEADYKAVVNAEEDDVTKRAKLYDLVMNRHDEVMPRMTEITKVRRALAVAMKDAEDSGNEERLAKVKEKFDMVENANKGMWDWMHSFKHPAPTDPQDQVMEYLQAELKKINQIDSDIDNAISEGNKFISELQVIQ
ncbi:MAG: hypothetical protein AAFV95_08995 [Bacteroidota bacterium]